VNVKEHLTKLKMHILAKEATLCNFLYKPHALQTGKPSPFRRHKVVVIV
jgi:hypothetical protein